MNKERLALAAVLFFLTSGPAFAQARAIEGVWGMTITLRDCATAAQMGPPFMTLVTFHQGGTVSESNGSPGYAPGQRTEGHGVWNHAGAASFGLRLVASILFTTPPTPPAPGFLAGWQVLTSTLTMTSDSSLSGAARADFYDVNRLPYRSVCPTVTGERFR
jgi:hypothetical protein